MGCSLSGYANLVPEMMESIGADFVDSVPLVDENTNPEVRSRTWGFIPATSILMNRIGRWALTQERSRIQGNEAIAKNDGAPGLRGLRLYGMPYRPADSRNAAMDLRNPCSVSPAAFPALATLLLFLLSNSSKNARRNRASAVL